MPEVKNSTQYPVFEGFSPLAKNAKDGAASLLIARGKIQNLEPQRAQGTRRQTVLAFTPLTE